MSKLELLSALPLLLFVWLLCVEASVHEYAGVRFVGKGNAFVVHGGSEGIYSSHPTHNTTAAVANGDAFIRWVNLFYFFCNFCMLLWFLSFFLFPLRSLALSWKVGVDCYVWNTNSGILRVSGDCLCFFWLHWSVVCGDLIENRSCFVWFSERFRGIGCVNFTDSNSFCYFFMFIWRHFLYNNQASFLKFCIFIFAHLYLKM